MNFLRVNKNSEVFTMKLETNNVTKDLLHSKLNNRRNKKDFKLLHTFDFIDECIELYGYKNGIEKNINRLELPSPIDCELYYDDLIFVSKNSNEYTDLQREEFDFLYKSFFDDFDDLDETTDDFEQDDYDYTDGFIIKD